MQTLHQDLDPSPAQDLTSPDHRVLRVVEVKEAAAYAEEVRVLRERVAELEAALALAGAGLDSTSSADFSPARTQSEENVAPSSEFSQPLTPAVVSVALEDVATQQATASSTTDSTSSPDKGFAAAWNDNQGTIEEQIAEKAFFEASSIDEASRNWLLDN